MQILCLHYCVHCTRLCNVTFTALKLSIQNIQGVRHLHFLPKCVLPVMIIAISNRHQLFAAIVLVSLFLLAGSVLAVVLNHRSKPRMDGSEDVIEKLRVTSSTLKTFSLECLPKYREYCLNGGKCVRLTDPLVGACFCKSLYVVKRCEKFLWYH